MSARRRRPAATFPCPHCGADVAAGAKACRECGSDATTGWQDDETIDYASIDLPDGYRDDAAGDELAPAPTPRWVRWTALLVAVVLAAALVVVFRARGPA